MAIAFLIDEQIPRPFLQAILHHNERGADLIEATQVGLSGAPPKSTADPDLLIWGEQNCRILISFDKKTLPDHFAEHLAAGRHSAGIFLVRKRQKFRFLVDYLATVTHASEVHEWVDRIFYPE